jgi:hypothetical protein
MPKRHNHPMANLMLYGKLNHGRETNGSHTELTGRVTAELGINLNAIILYESKTEKSLGEM